MAGEGSEKPLTRWQLVAYGQFVIPLAVIGLPVAVYIPPFYSSTLGLDLTAVGLILMLARISDVVTDPLIGRLSDRTRTRFGRRRPWVLAGVPVMMASALMLFVPPEEVTNLYLLTWIAAIYLGYTFITIPYGAWGAELSGDYKERNRITGSREMFLLIGLLIAISAPIAGAYWTGGGDGGGAAGRSAVGILGWLTVIMLPLCALIVFASVPEPRIVETKPIPFRRGLRVALRNGPFRIVLLSSIFGALAGSINIGVVIFFFEHVAGIGEASTVLIFTFFVAGVVGAPFWVWLGGRIGKHRAIAAAGFVSLFVFALVPAVIYLVKPAAPDAVFACLFAINVVQGLALGAAPILGPSIMADVVDLDTLKSGESRAAFLFAFLGMVRKSSEALGVGIALPILQWTGFNAQSESNSPEALFALLALYCLVPLVLWIVSIAIIMRYPITRERQIRLRAALERRISRRAELRRMAAD
ncbi:MAG: MFS transporter [Parvibaculum sp.]|jgi:Na+/melibiose symporter-like transporter|uniref:MFS transporter n=1 Tax=Parvibaculum sp. TaxID=2024848 RepID=UPI000CB9AC54|nr:MFS transporter [Parvibaculum sp.]MDZ4381701.1 MFS transporter [Parvibaculum sp.]PKP78713.1 MAG: MFS transporter [Alphaproteobacteria bacterium HGW-Alphaproteobacteria-3]